MHALERNTLTGDAIIAAGHRLSRPRGAQEACVFCPGQEARTPPTTGQIPAKGAWKARAFANAFPILPFHELVVDTPEHLQRLDQLDQGQVRLAVDLWTRRLSAARRAGGVPYLYRNDGAASGASIPHAHAQVVAAPEVPRVAVEAQAFAQSCPFEQDAYWKAPPVVEDRVAVATPRAARFAGETWLFPRAHAARFEDADAKTLDAFADALLAAARGLVEVGVTSYNVALHTAPDGGDAFHWHAELLPRGATLGGLELGAGLFINESP